MVSLISMHYAKTLTSERHVTANNATHLYWLNQDQNKPYTLKIARESKLRNKVRNIKSSFESGSFNIYKKIDKKTWLLVMMPLCITLSQEPIILDHMFMLMAKSIEVGILF